MAIRGIEERKTLAPLANNHHGSFSHSVALQVKLLEHHLRTYPALPVYTAVPVVRSCAPATCDRVHAHLTPAAALLIEVGGYRPVSMWVAYEVAGTCQRLPVVADMVASW